MIELFAESGPLSVAETREGQLLEQYFSQFSPSNILITNHGQLQT